MKPQHHHHVHPETTDASPAVDLASLYAAASGPTPALLPNRVPKEVHVTLEAREAAWEIYPGHALSAWGYQGTVPGPLIVANVGDTLVAHLINRPEPTVIHWHGIRLPSVMDGTESTQRLVQPGESFEYRFTLPDAGTFWYHSHANETVQLERGMYGALVVDVHAIGIEARLVWTDFEREADRPNVGTVAPRRKARILGLRLMASARREPA